MRLIWWNIPQATQSQQSPAPHLMEVLIRARVLDRQTFTLLTDPRVAISLRYTTFKVMEQKLVAD